MKDRLREHVHICTLLQKDQTGPKAQGSWGWAGAVQEPGGSLRSHGVEQQNRGSEDEEYAASCLLFFLLTSGSHVPS